MNRKQVLIVDLYWHILFLLLLVGNAGILFSSYPEKAENLPLYFFDVIVGILMLVGGIGIGLRYIWAVKVALIAAYLDLFGVIPYIINEIFLRQTSLLILCQISIFKIIVPCISVYVIYWFNRKKIKRILQKKSENPKRWQQRTMTLSLLSEYLDK